MSRDSELWVMVKMLDLKGMTNVTFKPTTTKPTEGRGTDHVMWASVVLFLFFSDGRHLVRRREILRDLAFWRSTVGQRRNKISDAM